MTTQDLRAKLRRWAMRSTSLSIPGAGSRAYVRAMYALWSPLYDRTIAWDPAYRANAERLVLATLSPGDEVLDVGVGTGLLAEYGAPLARRYVGIDYSGSMLAEAGKKIARRGLDNVSLRWGDARRLPFVDASFDVVLSSFALPHFAIRERVAVLAQMHRVLRPGGRLGLFLAQGECAPLFPTRVVLEQLLGDAGFEDMEIEDRDDVYRLARAVKV